jgi:hypothetical protein
MASSDEDKDGKSRVPMLKGESHGAFYLWNTQFKIYLASKDLENTLQQAPDEEIADLPIDERTPETIRKIKKANFTSLHNL